MGLACHEWRYGMIWDQRERQLCWLESDWIDCTSDYCVDLASVIWIKGTSRKAQLLEPTAWFRPYAGYQFGSSHNYSWQEWPKFPHNDLSHVSLESEKSAGTKTTLVLHQLWKPHQASIFSGIVSARPIVQNPPSTSIFPHYISETHMRVSLRVPSKHCTLLIWTILKHAIITAN